MRITALNSLPPRPDSQFVLYWMTSARRPYYNFALQRAAQLAREWHRPLLVLEALRCDYQFASPRLHSFVIEGMRDNRDYFQATTASYHPWLERTPGEGRGLVESLAELACAVVTDDFPCFFLPRMQAAVAQRLSVRLEKVDSNGLLPLRAAPKVYLTARDFRRFLQRELPEHLTTKPDPEPLKGLHLPQLSLPADILERWPAADLERVDLGCLDQRVGPVSYRGGHRQAAATLQLFLDQRLAHYPERNRPDREVASGLSPYLHFGHLSPHQVLAEMEPLRLGPGWWGMDMASEAFLDQLVTWRELGFNMCWQRPDYDRYESLPEWARQTLEEHVEDAREHLYTLSQLEQAQTHDPIWNAAQRQLLEDGRIHNYLRMLWGKKILEWTRHPREALSIMLELNNRYALDGRDPNSYTGIFWVMGRYDRPWFERAIYGRVRCMTSASTQRKFKLESYLRRWSGSGP